MISTVFFICLVCASLYAFFTGKNSLLLLLGIGFTQDIVRKLTPGEPIIFIVTAGAFFGFILLGIWAKNGFSSSQEPFVRWTNKIRMPLLFFILVLFFQLVHSFLVYRNVVVGLIGLGTYIAPFLALVVGYHLGNSVAGIRAFMRLYVIVGTLVALSVVLSFVGFEWAIFKEIGAGIKIYDQGTVLKSYSGIMRTGEVAAWHISTAACLLLILTFTSEKSSNMLIVVAIVAILMVAVALTGRRKMLMMTFLFIIFYLLSYPYYKKTLDPKYFMPFLCSMVVVWFGYEIINLDNYSESLRNYITRGSSVFGDASGRFIDLGISPINWAYNRVGLMGGGLGIASQGGYLFGGSDLAGGSGEGGLGKIMVELGLPGLVVIVWLVLAMASHINNGLKLCARMPVNNTILPLMVSLSVLLAVNVVIFSVATQVYGDFFILILLGVFGGFVFALPKLVVDSIQHELLRRKVQSIQSSDIGHGLP